jgi:putative membrane protein
LIVRPRPRLWVLMTATRGSIVPAVTPRILAMAVFAGGVAGLAQLWPGLFARMSPTPFALFGIALSIFLSFRNNACFERWWEARRIWGQIIYETRALARQTGDLEAPFRERLLRDACGFAHALAASLRDGDSATAAGPWTAAKLNGPNTCDAILADAGKACLELAAAGRIDGWRYQVLEERLSALSAAQAGCERIKTTPIPFAYSLLLNRTAYLFCLLLPFSIAGTFGYWTALIVAVISYTFFGLDEVGNELEDPFGLDPNDLPLDALVRTIEREVLASLGADELPPALEPENFVLS